MSTWTTRQEKILRQLYPVATKLEILRELAPHSWYAIRDRAFRLKIERRNLRRNWRTICQNHVMQTGLFKVQGVSS